MCFVVVVVSANAQAYSWLCPLELLLALPVGLYEVPCLAPGLSALPSVLFLQPTQYILSVTTLN